MDLPVKSQKKVNRRIHTRCDLFFSVHCKWLAAAARVGSDVAMNLKSLRGLSDTSTFFKNMDNVPVDALRGISKSDMTDLLKGFDDVQLAKIGKKLDPKYVEG